MAPQNQFIVVVAFCLDRMLNFDIKERFNLEVTYDQALKEYYEHKETNDKGNDK